MMLKYDIMFSAAACGALFGYVTAENEPVAIYAAAGFASACALVADWLTRPLEQEEEEDDDQNDAFG
jgi:hypothetical protein